MRFAISLLFFGLFLTPVSYAQDEMRLTIEQVMADPDWIGSPVGQAWWAWNSQQVQYQLKRSDSLIRDTYQGAIGQAGAAQKVEDSQRSSLDAVNPVYNAGRTKMAFLRNGDVFVRDLSSGMLRQVTSSNAAKSGLRFATDGGLIWKTDSKHWYHWRADGVVAGFEISEQLAPDSVRKADVLAEQQMRTISSLQRDSDRQKALREQQAIWREADSSHAVAPVYMGDEVVVEESSLSPDGRYLMVVTRSKGVDEGERGKMPVYVTASGYEGFESVRTRVGRNMPAPQRLWLAEVSTGNVRELGFDVLPGIKNDPLAALRKQAKLPALEGNRAIRLESPNDIQWAADGQKVAVMLHATDNKDRWIATVGLENAQLQPKHRLTDSAWINWGFNEFGWLADNNTLWWLSEESGYAHLYTQVGSAKAVQRTSGSWEVSSPLAVGDGGYFLFLCNRQWPGGYEVCRLDLGSNQIQEVSHLNGGVEDFSLSPDGQLLLMHYSESYLPSQLATVSVAGGEARVLTDTRSEAFAARKWIEPQYVQVPSQHGAGTIWGKLYVPESQEPGKKYPVVMFVHGAGYLQNVSARYPVYFREQMFHNLLVQEGYIVLDLDYRASEGYGRDWRTAIYRNMGHPELEDYLDGLGWVVSNHQGDAERAGIYGGSYGGFMTFMALFRSPGTFKAGAALRPVVDWQHYNHPYTANILNTPELDPEAYLRSSPIEYAEGLQDHLLIAHGMMDDNVFFQDSVNLTQRLIELEKDNWEIAPYPLERHGFVRPESWLDEYKRIYKLFEKTLK